MDTLKNCTSWVYNELCNLLGVGKEYVFGGGVSLGLKWIWDKWLGCSYSCTLSMSTVWLTQFGQKVAWVSFGKNNIHMFFDLIHSKPFPDETVNFGLALMLSLNADDKTMYQK